METTIYTETKTLAALCGLHKDNLIKWLRDFKIRPAIRGGKGQGDRSKWALHQVAGLALARHARDLGADPQAAGLLAQFIATMDAGQLEAAIHAGRHFVLLQGDSIFPRLITRETVDSHRLACDEIRTVSTPVCVINVALGLQQTRQDLEILLQRAAQLAAEE